jgi:CRP/FNR family transcriptional regulator
MVNGLKNCTDCVTCNEKISFFETLSNHELAILNEDRHSVRFKPNELIIKQGITATHIVSIIEGIAKIYIEGINNKNLLYGLVGPFELIEDPGLETDQKTHQFSVAALTSMKVCFINAQKFNDILKQNNEFANAVIKERSRNTVYYFDKLISLTQKHMLGRMADGLLYLGNIFYKSSHFMLNLSRQDLADLTGMSKDSAIRILKEFEKDRIISLKGKEIRILNPEQLQSISRLG